VVVYRVSGPALGRYANVRGRLGSGRFYLGYIYIYILITPSCNEPTSDVVRSRNAISQAE